MQPNQEKVDYTKLPPELLKKMMELEKSKPEYKQLQAILDIADMTQELIDVADVSNKNDEQMLKVLGQLGAVLTDAREQLVALNKKEAPETPDISKPVVAAVDAAKAEITKQLKAINVSPVVTVEAPSVSVPAPQVTVDAPKVDLSKVEAILRKEMPKAFKEAVDSIVIPENDDTGMVEILHEMRDWLESIDNATRKKPLPGSMKVTNPDGTPIAGTYAVRLDDTTTASVTYVGKAAIASTTSASVWQVQKIDETTGMVITWADGNSNFDNVWDNRASLTYA